MKKNILLLLCLFITFAVVAQKQQGLVRTIERPGQKSEGIKGATVKINGYPNALVSGKGGKFSFSIPGKKQGDRCLVTSVSKKGYTMTDKLPSFAYSFSTPAEIVMVSNKQFQQDEQRIRDKAEKKAAAIYEKRIAELERQLNEKTISEEQYREQLQQVFDGHENFLKMIDEMARRYAMTDYKGISEINRQIQECIENAELERADSLINSKGDLNQRKQELEEKRDVKQKIDSLSLALQEEIDFSTNELANDFYTKHLICASRYDNDSAAYYLIERAKLDTTNVDWLIEAGSFLEKRLANYNLAKSYYNKALIQSTAQFGDRSLQTANCYNSFGSIIGYLGELESAIDYLHKSYSIYELSNNKEGVISVLNNIATIECMRANYQVAEQVFTKSINLIDTLLTDKELIITSYNGKGISLAYQNNYKDAIEWMSKALIIGISYYGNLHPLVAEAYNNLGGMYMSLYDISTAQDYFEKALSIQRQIFGESHTATAYSLYNLACIYNEKEDYTSAMGLLLEVRDIREHILGKYHSDVAECYNAMGYTCGLEENHKDALRYYLEALDIWNHCENSQQNIARVLNNIGRVYSNMEMHSDALDYFKKSLETHLAHSSEETPSIATCYNNIAGEYDSMGEYDKAIEYYNQALAIREKIFGSKDYLLSAYNCNIGVVYEKLQDYTKALDYYQQALNIRVEILGPDHSKTKIVRDKIDEVKKLMAQ